MPRLGYPGPSRFKVVKSVAKCYVSVCSAVFWYGPCSGIEPPNKLPDGGIKVGYQVKSNATYISDIKRIN